MHDLVQNNKKCIFDLILVGIPSSLILSIKNVGVGLFYLIDKIRQKRDESYLLMAPNAL